MEKILDRKLDKEWGSYIDSKTEILWSAKPKNEISIRVLETDVLENGVIHSILGLIMTWFIITYHAKELVNNGATIFGVLLFFGGLIAPFIGDVIFYYKNSKIEYAITKDYVLFKLFNGFYYQVHAIPMHTIMSVHSTNIGKEHATLHIVTSASIDFSTQDIKTGDKRDHPTFEQIKHHELALAIIKDRIKQNPKQKLVYQQPKISKTGKTFLEYMFLLLIMVFLFIGYELYIEPILQLEKGSNFSRIPQFFYLTAQICLFVSLHYIRKSEELINESIFEIIGVNILLILVYIITLSLF